MISSDDERVRGLGNETVRSGDKVSNWFEKDIEAFVGPAWVGNDNDFLRVQIFKSY